MRVLLISHTCQSRREGQPKAEWLGEIPGVELLVVSPDRFRVYDKYTYAEPPDMASFRYQVSPVRWPWAGPANCYLHHYPKLREIFESFRPDVIDLWEEPWGLVSVQAVRLRNRLMPSVPIISETEQNVDRQLPPPFEWFRRFTLRRVQFVIGRNREAIDIVKRRGYVGPTAVISNAVDERLFCPLDRAACRRKYAIDGFVFGYVGRLVEKKGLLDLIRAMRQLPPHVRLMIAGEGPVKAQLLAAEQEEGLRGRIKLLGHIPIPELPAVMNAMDVLVLPSHTTTQWKEQFGRVIIEAHACGTPVVGSDSGAIPDVIGPGGVVAREQDVDALVRALRLMIDSPEHSRELGERGRERALKLFTWRSVARRQKQIYDQVLRRMDDSSDPSPMAEPGDVYGSGVPQFSAADPALSRRRG